MTAKERSFQFRLTDDEFQQLEEEAKKAGFLTVSDYVRHMTIGPGRFRIDDKLDAIIKRLDQEGKIAALTA